ncbi:MAG TPA: hypothetical protein VL099_08945 [Candidatus Binatia bacterium]|nr:hypothetical protein [Candidatus Binatia bacterium]
MTKKIMTGLAMIAALAAAPAVLAQAAAQPQAAAPAQKAPAKTAKRAPTAQDLNVQEYVKLLRQNVRSDKAKLMGAVMQLDADQAAKFWPIYKDYSAELDKVNDLRVANIEDYAKNYTQMTDQKADELIHNAMDYQKQRNDLLGKYYDRVKESLGAITAARFVQVEHQLLLIIDLQIASELPVVGS